MRPDALIPVDANSPCGSERDPALYDFRVRGPDGGTYCRVPIVRESDGERAARALARLLGEREA